MKIFTNTGAPVGAINNPQSIVSERAVDKAMLLIARCVTLANAVGGGLGRVSKG